MESPLRVDHDRINQYARDVQKITTALKDKPGALLPILHAIQDDLGYVPAESVPAIAKTLNLSRAEVHGVISFYHYFRDTPPGKHTIHLCQCRILPGNGRQAIGKACENPAGYRFS